MTGRELEQQLLRLAEAGIELVPSELSTHYVLARDGFACLVEKRSGGFGAIGSVCKATEAGFAVVTWDGARAWFTGKGFRQEASEADVVRFRSLAADLRQALQGGYNSED